MRNPFRRRKAEQRSAVPWNYGDPLVTNAPSQDRVLRLATVYSAIRYLTDAVSTLPLKPYRRLGDAREPMSALPPLFQFLEEDGTLIDWLTQLVGSLVIHGNAIGLIVSRDDDGSPTSVVWRPHSEWYVDDLRAGVRPQWYWMGRKIDRLDLVHIPWVTVPGRVLGLSPLESFAMAVEGGLAAQKYGNAWFDAGGIPPGTFKNSQQTIDADDAKTIKERLVTAIRTHEPIVYGKDWDYNAITIPPNQAQFVETQKLTANTIAAIYGIAPEEIGGEPANSLTYSNEEMRQTTRLANLRPWLVRVETGLSALLPELQYVRFNGDATVRADLKTRYDVYKVAREIGLLSLDEIRTVEDRPPLPDGQGTHYLPQTAPTQPPTQEPSQQRDEPGRLYVLDNGGPQ